VAKWFVTVTAHITTSPPPLTELSHCRTSMTGSADVVVVVVQTAVPSRIGPAAPVHTFTVTVEGAAARPALVT
jgi:hypothetical protein